MSMSDVFKIRTYQLGSFILERINKSWDQFGESLKKQDSQGEPEEENEKQMKRENLSKNFQQPEPDLNQDFERRKRSMLDSQGKSDHSGSAYHGPGNVDHEKVNSNMAHRNYDNHQSN